MGLTQSAGGFDLANHIRHFLAWMGFPVRLWSAGLLFFRLSGECRANIAAFFVHSGSLMPRFLGIAQIRKLLTCASPRQGSELRKLYNDR